MIKLLNIYEGSPPRGGRFRFESNETQIKRPKLKFMDRASCRFSVHFKTARRRRSVAQLAPVFFHNAILISFISSHNCYLRPKIARPNFVRRQRRLSFILVSSFALKTQRFRILFFVISFRQIST